MESQEILAQITAAFQTIIKERNLHPMRFEIEPSTYGSVEIYITAPEFSGKTIMERKMMIWPALEKRYKREFLNKIEICLLLAPEEDPEFEKLQAA
jgi:stress-induced morphogen